MNKNYILCNGFNEDGDFKTIDNLVPCIPESDNIQYADYGDFKFLGVRFFNDNVASILAGMANPDSIGIGHSNGCAILTQACWLTDKIKTLVLINPALDNDTAFPATVENVLVYFNPYDDVVKASKFLAFHDWGDMGRVGYTGNDINVAGYGRVQNFNTYELFSAVGHSGVLNGHSQRLFFHIENELEKLDREK